MNVIGPESRNIREKKALVPIPGHNFRAAILAPSPLVGEGEATKECTDRLRAS